MQKVILITGAASGIGRGAALRLLKEGHVVYGGDIDFEAMQKLESQGVKPLLMDVTDEQSVHDGVTRIVEEQGCIDGLFANAGYMCMGMIECVSIDEAKASFDVNLFGVARCVQAVLPHMRKAMSGHILITSSVVGLVSVPGMAWYPASKHAVEAFANALRMEVKRFHIKVATIQPGFISTNLMDASLPTLDQAELSPVADVYRREQKNFRSNVIREFNKGSPVETISEVVADAFASEHPKHHYRPNPTSVAGALSACVVPETLSDLYMIETFIADPDD